MANALLRRGVGLVDTLGIEVAFLAVDGQPHIFHIHFANRLEGSSRFRNLDDSPYAGSAAISKVSKKHLSLGECRYGSHSYNERILPPYLKLIIETHPPIPRFYSSERNSCGTSS